MPPDRHDESEAANALPLLYKWLNQITVLYELRISLAQRGHHAQAVSGVEPKTYGGHPDEIEDIGNS